MRIFLSLYNSYFAKIVMFFKHFIIINILFISSAYPLSNTNEYKSSIITVNNSVTESFIMQRAFEAEMLAKNGEYEEAAQIYYEISLKSDDPSLAKRATQLAGYAHNYKLMLKSSERWLNIGEDKSTITHIRISIFLALNETDLAAKEALLAIKISKDKDKFALVYDTIRVFEDDAIKKIFDEIYRKYKNEYLANFYYAQILINVSEYQKAIKVIENSYKFEEFSKKESRWGIFLANAYYELGKNEQSVKILKDYLSYSPKDLYLNQYYVKILTLQENYDEAIKHYRFMSANKLISFSDISVAKKMALLNIKVKKYIDADIFIKSIENKDINSYNFLKGMFYSQKNNYKEAEKFFKKVEKDDDNFINSIKEISKKKIKNKDYEKLKNFFINQYKDIRNKDLEIRLIIIETEIFFNEKKYNYSMERINSGLKKYKDNSAFLYTRALVAEQIDRLDILESDLKKLIEMEPRNAQALNALGYTWANKNINLEEASKYIDMALKIKPNDSAILDTTDSFIRGLSIDGNNAGTLLDNFKDELPQKTPWKENTFKYSISNLVPLGNSFGLSTMYSFIKVSRSNFLSNPNKEARIKFKFTELSPRFRLTKMVGTSSIL